MKSIFQGGRAWTALAMAGCLFTSTNASAVNAVAILSDIKFTLTDLKADGVPASFSYGAGTSDTLLAYTFQPNLPIWETKSNQGEFFETSSDVSFNGYVPLGSHQDYFPAGFYAEAQIGANSLRAYVYSDGLPYNFSVQASVKDSTFALVLAPHSKLEITGSSYLYLDISNHDASEYQEKMFYAQTNMSVTSGTLFGQNSANAWIWPADMTNWTNQTQQLTLTLTNSGDTPLSGYFFASASVQSHPYGPPPTVPEPESVALIMTGLATLWLTARRRRAISST